MNIKYRTACLIKIVLLIICGTVMAQQFVQSPKSYIFTSKIGGAWLTVQRHNTDCDADDWNPSFVSITSDYKPVSHKLPDGRWEIEFTSEIAKDLP